MPLIDTHCHYNLEPLYSGDPFCFKIKEGSPVLQMNWRDHWQKARQNGIDKSIVVGAGLKSSQKAVEIAQAEPDLYAVVGIHPERAHKITALDQAITQIESLANQAKVIAIGEVGLDYFYLDPNLQSAELQKIKTCQKELFIGQIELAKKLDLPLVIHARDQGEEAYFATLEIIRQHWSFANPIIFHCVSGPPTYIEQALALPKSYFGFDGNLSFKKAEAQRAILQLVQNTDSSKILLETDAPYLAPEPHRGSICEPWMLSATASYMQQKFQVDLAQIYQNSLRAFKI